MGKKKNAKKLRQQQQQTTAPATLVAVSSQPSHSLIQAIAPPTTQAPFPPAATAAQQSAQQQQQPNGQSKKSKKKQRANERRAAKRQQLQQTQQQAASETENVATEYYVGADGHIHERQLRDGEDDSLSQRDNGGGDFVGQPLLDVLDGVHLQQQSGSEAEAAHRAPGASSRRASLARRPAAQQGGGAAVQQDGSGPPPGAPTQPRAARNAAAAAPPLGAPTGPKSMARPQAQSRPAAPRSDDAPPQPQPPQHWQHMSGSGAPGFAAADAALEAYQAPTFGSNSQVPTTASGSDNPFGYNVQNATWDWNTFGGAASNAAAMGYAADQSNEADGGLNGSGSHAYASNEGTDSAAWPSAYGDTTSGYLQQQQQQNYFPYQPPDQFSGWNPYLQQQQQQQPSFGYQPGYYNPAFQISSGLRYIHGHTNSFTPFAPMASVQHYYQGHSWHVDKRYSAPNRGFASKAGKNGGGRVGLEDVSDNSDGGVKVGGSEPVRRSKRLATKDGGGGGEAGRQAQLAFERAIGNMQQQKMKSPAPDNGRRSRSGSPWKKKISGPPKPNPTAEYLSQASQEPTRLQKPNTLLVIIDLNGTLVHRPNRKRSSKIVCRPYVQGFLDYLLANHRVMVWSSARPENVGKMCAQLFTPSTRDCLAAEWGRDTLGLTPKQYQEKVQVYKTLGKVWGAADAERWHHRHNYSRTYETNRFGQHNTFLVDDSVLKAASEPHNLVQVEEFEGKPEQMETDVLRQVVGYLEEAKWWSDVSAWVRMGNRFEAGAGWDYAWPEGTEADAVPEGLVPEGDVTGHGLEWWGSELAKQGGGGGEEKR